MPLPVEADSPLLLAMVPGVGIRPNDFHENGFVAAVERHRQSVTVAVIDPGTDAFLDNSVEARMLEMIRAARTAAGASRIWLAGISLGCQGILRCVRAQPGLADGLLLLTPYLASTGLIAKVARAGGLRHWAATTDGRDNVERTLLAWLATTPLSALPPMLVGYAMNDRFATTATLLGDLLPARQLISVPGAHDWQSWIALWRLMLERNPFDRPVGLGT